MIDATTEEHGSNAAHEVRFMPSHIVNTFSFLRNTCWMDYPMFIRKAVIKSNIYFMKSNSGSRGILCDYISPVISGTSFISSTGKSTSINHSVLRGVTVPFSFRLLVGVV